MAVCASCGEDNPGRAKFCLSCGAAMAEGPRARAEERKVVSVLFCDLVGFTAASEQADPEDVRARIDPYFARLRHAAESFGGTVDKFIGDAVMAVFGAPIAHEDDAERAVRAGLQILQEIDELNASHPGLGLVVRIGINTGEVLVRLESSDWVEGIVTGDVVTTASRLQAIAPEGGVAVSETTYQATRDVFDYGPLDPVMVKGKSEPLRMWRAVRPRTRFGTDLLRGHTAALVGRDRELRQLEEMFERAAVDRTPRLVTLVGEPGIGKSRLVAELATYVGSLADPVTWLQGRCLPYGEGITFWALGEVVKAHAGILESDSPEVAGDKLDRVLPQGDRDREWFRQRLRPLVGLEADAPASREESFACWRRFLGSIAEGGGPTVVAFEDLHWADPALLDFVEHLAGWSQGVPLVVVATTRPELLDRHPGWAAGLPTSTRMWLHPLSDADTARLVSALLEQADFPAEVRALVLEQAGGNPLYAEEFVRMLKDRGQLVPKGSSWELLPGAELTFPTSIQALIAARVDALPPDRKPLLQDASVVGRVFWAGAVAEMGRRDRYAAAQALDTLARKEMLRAARESSLAGEEEYSFSHALVRDVCYGQIPRAQRSAKHLAAASWIEKVSTGRVDDHAEILAFHYTEALRLARAAGEGELAVELEGSARRCLLLAGDRALGLDTTRALEHYERALELTSIGDQERPVILGRWADAARQSGRLGEAAEALRKAVAGFEEQHDSLGAARTMATLSGVLVYSGDPSGYPLAEEAVARLEREPPGPDLVAACSQVAGLKMRQGAYAEAIEWADRALSLAADLGMEEPIRALSARGTSRCCLGDRGGLKEERRALAAAIDRGLGREAAVLYNNIAVDLASLEGPRETLRMAEEGIRFAEGRGIDEWALWTKTTLISQWFAFGEWDQILSEAGPLAERLEAGGMTPPLIWVRLAVARVFLFRGEFERAAPLAQWTVEAARTGGSADERPPAFLLGALVRQWAGEPEGAKELLTELERAGLQDNDNYMGTVPDLVRIALAIGDQELAERLAQGIRPPPYPMHEYNALTTRALLAEAHGEVGEAAGLFAEAAERWGSFGDLWERTRMLLDQGRCLVTRGDGADASRVLNEARATFVRLGAKPFVAETDALLDRAAASTA